MMSLGFSKNDAANGRETDDVNMDALSLFPSTFGVWKKNILSIYIYIYRYIIHKQNICQNYGVCVCVEMIRRIRR